MQDDGQTMDLSIIKKRLTDRKYANVDECIYDFKTMFEYCVDHYKQNQVSGSWSSSLEFNDAS